MPTGKKRPRVVLCAAITADGKLDGEISGAEEKDCRYLLETGQVDELRLTVRPRIDGRRGAEALSGKNADFFSASIPCRLLRMEVHGDECLLHYRVSRPTQKRRPAR